MASATRRRVPNVMRSVASARSNFLIVCLGAPGPDRLSPYTPSGVFAQVASRWQTFQINKAFL
jgi:hypothetical protein